jgi:hypothetical protein
MPYCVKPGNKRSCSDFGFTCGQSCPHFCKKWPMNPETGWQRAGIKKMRLVVCSNAQYCTEACDRPFSCPRTELPHKEFVAAQRQCRWSHAHPVPWCSNPDGRCKRQMRLGHHFGCLHFHRELCHVDRMKNIL